MTEKTTIDRIKDVLADQLGVELEQIEETSTIDTLGGDSLDEIECVMALEEEFDTEISDEEVSVTSTVADLVKLIDTKTAA